MSRPVVRCQNCRVGLRQIVYPAGYVINVIMVLLVGAYLFWLFEHPTVLETAWPAAFAGLVIIVLLPTLCYVKWGFGYAVVAEDSGNRTADL